MTKRFAILLAAVAAVSIGAPGRSIGTPLQDAKAGQEVFQQYCKACHNADSNEAKFGPGLKGLFKNAKLPGTGKPTSEENVRAQIANGGGGMPGFKGTISDKEIDDLIAYLKTL